MSSNRSITPRNIRKLIIEQSKRANVGLVGSALSIADIVAVLFDGQIRNLGTDVPSRDRFVLSKGHAALAVYSALYLKGLLPRKELQSYYRDGSVCGAHPHHCLNGIDFSTESGGMGPAFAAGAALAARLTGEDFRAFVLVSDSECQEGSLWETAFFGVRHELSNLVVIVDDRGPHASSGTANELGLPLPAEKWSAFGWEVHEVDGHHPGELSNTLGALDTRVGRPKVLIAKTVYGKGVSFLESRRELDDPPLSDRQYAMAMKELEEAPTE